MRTSKKVTETVERKVAALLLQDRRYSGEYLKREVEKQLKKEGKNYKFTARTYNNVKKRILPNITISNPLDEKWSIGACEKNNIPDDMIPMLMDEARLFLGKMNLSIRQARWMSRLRILVAELIIKYKDDKIRGSMLFQIANLYAFEESISESLGNKYFNSGELDEIIFVKEYPRYCDFETALDTEGWNHAREQYELVWCL